MLMVRQADSTVDFLQSMPTRIEQLEKGSLLIQNQNLIRFWKAWVTH